MALVVAPISVDWNRKSDKVFPSNKRGYLHGPEADFRVRELRQGGSSVSVAIERRDGSLFASLLCRDPTQMGAAQQGQGDDDEQAMRSVRKGHGRDAIGRRSADVLFKGVQGGRDLEHSGNRAEKLSRRGRLLVVVGHHAGRLWPRQAGGTSSGGASSKLRAPRRADSRGAGHRPPLSQSIVHQSGASGAGHGIGEYPARRAGFARCHAKTLGLSAGRAQ